MSSEMPEAALATWLAEQLLQQRNYLEAQHQLLLEQFAAQQQGLSQKTQDNPRPADHQLLSSQPEERKQSKQLSSETSRNTSESVVRTPFVYRIVVHEKFETFFGFLIVLNTVLMAFEAQYVGLGMGHKIGYESHHETSEATWPGANTTFKVLDWFFGCMYSVELVMKMIGLRHWFFDGWNLFDAAIVLAWYFDKFAENVVLPIDMMLLRLLRLFRLLRLVKLAKALTGVDQLLVILTALKGSVAMLMWTVILLISCMLMFALLLNQLLVAYVVDNETMPMATRTKAFYYFGTFARSILSMFELTLANWIPISRFLVDDVSEWLLVCCLLFKLTMGFSAIAVINGCFIKETFKNAAADDTLMVLEKKREAEVHMKKMTRLLEKGDTNGDGFLSQEDFETTCRDPEVKTWLGAQGLDASHPEILYAMLDADHKGHLLPGDLVKGVGKLKGFAKSLDVAHANMEAEHREKAIIKKMTEMSTNMTNMHLLLQKLQPGSPPRGKTLSKAEL